MIDYQQLNALAAVISEGGFEKAAIKLCLTQSAVSRRIRTLELLMGEPVVIRSVPPKLTSKGQKLLNHLQQVKQLELELGLLHNDESAVVGAPISIRLASNADSIATWLPEALGLSCQQQEQPIKFDLVLEDQSVILNRMKAGEVMACISSEEKAVNGGLVSYLGELRYRVVASPSFIRRYNIHSLSDLARCPCLVFDADDKLQHTLLKEVTGKDPHYFHLCPSPEGFKQSAIAGLGFALLPELQINDAIANKSLSVLGDNYAMDIPLYWHYWQTEGSVLKQLRKNVESVAKRQLVQLM